jgi:hypothetical protein
LRRFAAIPGEVDCTTGTRSENRFDEGFARLARRNALTLIAPYYFRLQIALVVTEIH